MQEVKPIFVSPSTVDAVIWADPEGQPEPARADPYRLVLDRAAGVIRGIARGNWTVDETARYCADLRRLVVESRDVCGRVRVLLDRREVSVQSPEVCAALADANRTIFAGDDKIALVVTTSVAKASLRHRMPHLGTKAFLSMTAAETWLSI